LNKFDHFGRFGVAIEIAESRFADQRPGRFVFDRPIAETAQAPMAGRFQRLLIMAAIRFSAPLKLT